MKQRDPFFDNAKILLMVFVVLGHVLPIDLNSKANIATYEWIFSFHMPLFVFISGYFTRLSSKIKFWNSICNFAETLFVFTLIHVTSSFIQGKSINVYQILIIPRWTLWYLLCLIWWRLLLYFTPTSIRNNYTVLILFSIILCLAGGWIPIDSQLSFQRTFAFFPYFIVGYIAGNNNLEIKVKKGKFFILFFLIFIGFLYFIIPKTIISALYQNICFFRGPLSSPFINFVLRVAWLFFASVMSYCFLSIVPQKEYRWTHFGQLTLFIYMYHSVILSWRYILRDEFHLPTNLFFCILYSIIVLGIIWLMTKWNFFHWLLNPISLTMKKIKS